MTFATERVRIGRDAVNVLELDLDFCTRTPGAIWIERAPQLGGETFIYSLAVHGGKLYGGTFGDGTLVEWNGTDAWVEVAPQLNVQTAILSLAVHNGKLYGGTSPNGKLFEWNDVNAWVEVAPQLAETRIWSLAVHGGKLYGGTEGNGKLYEWNDVNAWVEVAPQLGAETVIYSLAVHDGKLYGGTAANGKLYEWNDVNAWVEVAPKLGAETVIDSLAVYNDRLYGGTHPNGKLYEWDDDAAWVEVAEQLGAEVRVHALAVHDEKLYGGTSQLGHLHEWGGCRATETGDDLCYKTRKTTNSVIDYDAGVLTYRFAEARSNIPPTADAFPTLLSVALAPTIIRPGKGLGQRAQVTCVLQDVPHHDRGTDPFVTSRTYTPEDQGTFWGKFLSRNPFYQGRPMRILSGYIKEGGFDLTNDFETRTYVIEQINGPDPSGKVTVIGKDVLKLADDERAQAPTPSTGVLDADINDAVGSLTLSPSGIGSEYDASGSIRIGSEVMTFTRAADVMTIVRGTDGTTAAAHSANDSVQQCLRYTAQEAHDVLEDLLLNFAGVSAAFLPTSDWEDEVETKLGPHQLDRLITEPTGVSKLINEIAESYLLYLWWDERASEVKLAVIAPFDVAPDVLDDTSHILANSVSVQEMPDERRSQVWIYYNIIDPTTDLAEPRNFEILKVRVDQDAESSDQYDEKRVERIFSLWITQSGDAIRLGGRLLSSVRDNPRRVRFSLDAKDFTKWTGDIVTLNTAQLQDSAGANLQTTLRIIETRDDGHRQDLVGLDENFDGRYARWGPNGLPDYDGATDDQKRRYFWIGDAATDLGGDGAYKVG